MTDDPLTDAASAEERAAAGEQPPEAEELFPMGALDGDGVTPQNMIPKGANVALTVSIGSAKVPLKGGGLLDHRKFGRVLTTYRVKSNVPVYHHGDSKDKAKVTGYELTQNLEAVHVEHANNVEALVEREFADLLAADSEAAGRLLTRMTRAAAEVGAVTRAA